MHFLNGFNASQISFQRNGNILRIVYFFASFLTLKVINEVTRSPDYPFLSPSLFVIGISPKDVRKRCSFMARCIAACAWMKFSCGIKSAREEPSIMWSFYLPRRVFPHELPNAHLPWAFLGAHWSLLEGILFNAQVGILVFWYFHLVANSRRFSSVRTSVFRAYICKASIRLRICYARIILRG